MSSQKPKITFLVGAGLVYDAGLPLSNDLTKKFREHLSDQVETTQRATIHCTYRFIAFLSVESGISKVCSIATRMAQ